MNRIEQVIEYSRKKLINEIVAHDFSHSERVMKTAEYIGKNCGEVVDLEVIKIAGITHDIIDKKVALDIDLEIDELSKFLLNIGYNQNQVKQVFDIISNMSFSSGRIPSTIEGKIVQDADRLEAIGAISIARAFAYGGKLNRVIYEEDNNNSSIGHFYEKLLLLKDMMNTDIGKQLAIKRHEFMESYLNQFFIEWNLEDLK